MSNPKFGYGKEEVLLNYSVFAFGTGITLQGSGMVL
jgi:hypothetical protein